ncbi:unnamed protein product [Chrysoparadoxa australica]
MGKFYLGHVSYRGTDYYGWQKQKDLPTLQEEIFNTLRGLYPLGRIDVKATSRTDRGVHAFSQVVKFLAPRREEPEDVLKKLNEALPDDIVFNDLIRINKSFKVTYLSLYKEYLYFFSPKTKVLPYAFVGHWAGTNPLDIEKMKEASQLFVGKHDFSRFQYRSDAKGGYEREVLETNIFKAQDLFPEAFSSDEGIYCFHVKGRGFLKQMVRMMVGGLFKYGSGLTTLDEFKTALEGVKTEKKITFIAPAGGLFLYHIAFPEVLVSDIPRHVVDEKNWLKRDPKLSLWKGKEDMSFPLEVYPYEPPKD